MPPPVRCTFCGAQLRRSDVCPACGRPQHDEVAASKGTQFESLAPPPIPPAPPAPPEERGLWSLDTPGSPTQSENVTGRRIVAALIDIALFVGLFLVLGLTMGETQKEGGRAGVSLSNGPAILFFAIVVLYYFLLEWLVRATVGKLVMGLRVAGVEGVRPDAVRIGLRTILRLVDGLPAFYIVGLIAVAASQRRQRLGDMVARTVVVAVHARHAPAMTAATASAVERTAAPTPASPTSSRAAEVGERLRRAATLHDQGLLTDEEYDRKRHELADEL